MNLVVGSMSIGVSFGMKVLFLPMLAVVALNAYAGERSGERGEVAHTKNGTAVHTKNGTAVHKTGSGQATVHQTGSETATTYKKAGTTTTTHATNTEAVHTGTTTAVKTGTNTTVVHTNANWDDAYWSSNKYGYWNGQRGYWTTANGKHIFVVAQ
jgi:hypothetical protein